MPKTAAQASTSAPPPQYDIEWIPPTPPPTNLPEEDGVPLETPWHRDAMNLLIEVIRYARRDRTDVYVGGNMFVHFSSRQVRNNDFRGPDVFFVRGVDGARERRYWAVWEEEGHYPNVIVELISPSTAGNDRITKKEVYDQIFRTPEYFCYDPDGRRLEGWRINGGRYEDLVPNERGWLWSEELNAWLGTWEGLYQHAVRGVYPRLFDAEGRLIPTFDEAAEQHAEEERQRADAERQRADAERQRAEAAEAELTRLRALLAEKGAARPA